MQALPTCTGLTCTGMVCSGCGAGMGYVESLTSIHKGKGHSLPPPGRRRLADGAEQAAGSSARLLPLNAVSNTNCVGLPSGARQLDQCVHTRVGTGMVSLETQQVPQAAAALRMHPAGCVPASCGPPVRGDPQPVARTARPGAEVQVGVGARKRDMLGVAT